MDKRNFSNVRNLKNRSRYAVSYGQKGSFPIDQTPSQSFNINPDTGRPMSDIQKLVRLQDSVNQQAFLNTLRDYKSNYLPKDMTDEDALVFLKSRHQQTKSELLDYREALTRYQLQQKENEIRKSQLAEQVKLNKERDDYFNSLFENYKLNKSES